MRTLAKFITLFAGIGLLLSCSSGKPDARDSHNNPIYLKEYRGNIVLINYWAPWCKPCIHELPALNSIYNTPNSNITVLAVSFDEPPNSELNSYQKKWKLNFPMLSTFPLTKIGAELPSTLPETFILNRQGKLVKTLKGPQTKEQFLAAIGSVSRES